MDSSHSTFASLEVATAVLHRIREPLIIIRFAPDPAEWMVVAVNDAAAAISTMPAVGDHPDSRRDRDVTPDLELEYLYHQLVERGHARQLLSLDGGHLYELAVSRIMVAGMIALFAKVFRDETAATAIEYGLIAALIAVAAKTSTSNKRSNVRLRQCLLA